MECSLSASENSKGGYCEDFSRHHTEDQAIRPAAVASRGPSVTLEACRFRLT
jgi:hypothetical protein